MKFIALSLFALFLAACTTTEQRVSGAAAGAGTGALIGGPIGAVAGGAIGAVAAPSVAKAAR
jgi:osmotically inducible lipoprotein OsmB